jgi:hypothetical protein
LGMSKTFISKQYGFPFDYSLEFCGGEESVCRKYQIQRPTI